MVGHRGQWESRRNIAIQGVSGEDWDELVDVPVQVRVQEWRSGEKWWRMPANVSLRLSGGSKGLRSSCRSEAQRV